MAAFRFKTNLKTKWGKIVAFMSFNHVYMYTSLDSKYIKILTFRIFSEKINNEIHSNSTNKQVFNK